MTCSTGTCGTNGDYNVAGAQTAATSITGPNISTASAPAVMQNAIFMGDSRFCTQGYSGVCAWGTVPYPIDSPGAQIHTDYVNDLMQTPLFAGRYQTVKNYGIAGQAVCNYNYASFGHPYSPAVTGYTGSYFELEGGINDLNSGATDTTVEGCLSAIFSSAKADGYTQLVAHTIYGSQSCNTSTTCPTFLYNVNGWIKNNQGVLFSRVIDDAGILGETSGYPISPDWYDGTHLTASGYKKLATNAAATLALPVSAMKAPYTPTPAGLSVSFLGYPNTQITTGSAGKNIGFIQPQQTVVGSGGTATVSAYSVLLSGQTRGVGYSGTGTCSVNGGTYTVQATCSATLNSAGGLDFVITAGGTYTAVPSSISFSGFTYTAGTAATATPALSIQAVTVTAGGSGYTTDLTAIFPNCTGAIPATVTQSSGVIQSVTATGGVCTSTTSVQFVSASFPNASTYTFTPTFMQFLPQAPHGNAATATQNFLASGLQWNSIIYKSGSVNATYTCLPYYGGGSNTLGMNCTVTGTGLYYGPWAAPLFFGRYGTGESANLTASGTITIDQSVSSKGLYIYTLTGDTTFAVTNPYNGESLTFVIKPEGHTATWPATFHNAPPISSSQNSVSGTYVVASCIYSATQFLWYCNSSASNTPSIRAGAWSVSSATSVAVTFSTAMASTPTNCSVTPSASTATTGQPFATSLATTGFTVNVPTSGTLVGMYSCDVNNSN